VDTSSLTTRKAIAFVAALAVAFLATLAILVASAPQASAQLPSICDQYPDLPQCQGPTGTTGTTGPTGTTGTTGPVGPTAGVDAGATGALPFTGYPVTALILLLLILLLTGLAIRGYLAARDRLPRNRQAGP